MRFPLPMLNLVGFLLYWQACIQRMLLLESVLQTSIDFLPHPKQITRAVGGDPIFWIPPPCCSRQVSAMCSNLHTNVHRLYIHHKQIARAVRGDPIFWIPPRVVLGKSRPCVQICFGSKQHTCDSTSGLLIPSRSLRYLLYSFSMQQDNDQQLFDIQALAIA